MSHIVEYINPNGGSPFRLWLDGLDKVVAVRVTTAVFRMQMGNFGSVKGVGAGLFESRLTIGPGYRIYFGKDGDQVIVLVGGGTKKRQANDIATARQHWEDYKARKRAKNATPYP